MKNAVKLVYYYHPQQLKEAISEFVKYYNHRRFHKSLQNITPADVHFWGWSEPNKMVK